MKELMKHYNVWMSDIKNLPDALHMIDSIGKIVDKEEKAKELIKEITKRFSEVITSKITTAAYIIWNDPIMTVGGDTFINDMMHYSGFENVFKNKARYPEISEAELSAAKPEVILLSSEPFPFKEKHIQRFESISRTSKVITVDGEMFSWYGSRLLKAPVYFKSLNKQMNF
jgi:ABC-type Fe3+-hydroxamate transport system substrate-binding protein